MLSLSILRTNLAAACTTRFGCGWLAWFVCLLGGLDASKPRSVPSPEDASRPRFHISPQITQCPVFFDSFSFLPRHDEAHKYTNNRRFALHFGCHIYFASSLKETTAQEEAGLGTVLSLFLSLCHTACSALPNYVKNQEHQNLVGKGKAKHVCFPAPTVTHKPIRTMQPLPQNRIDPVNPLSSVQPLSPSLPYPHYRAFCAMAAGAARCCCPCCPCCPCGGGGAAPPRPQSHSPGCGAP